MPKITALYYGWVCCKIRTYLLDFFAFFFLVLDGARCLSKQICAGKEAGALGDKFSIHTIFFDGIGPEASVTAGNPIWH
jgi:hypothetical protein